MRVNLRERSSYSPFASGTLAGVANWNLEVYVTRRDGTVVVTPRGEVDLLTVSQLEDALRTATRGRGGRSSST